MKNIKKFIAITMLFCISASFAQGDRHKEKMEQVKSLKVAFITNELNLTSDEATKFWPLYNAFEDKQRELRKQKIGRYVDRRDNAELDKMTDKEAAALLSQMEDNEEELYQLRKKFVTSLKGVLPAVKIIKLKKAEDDFNRKLLQQYKNKGPRK
jgi:Spy/CpxP family protein refolding chaperone